VVSLASAATALAQGGDGSLRGTVKDDQGGALPGVTVTATSPALLSNSLAISDAAGNYRLINLPPGTYALTAELAGFSVFRREAVLLRAGANFQVDITMAIGTLEETITVSGDSPMLEVSNPSNVLNIDADFQKTLPLVEGKYWSDFLHMTPGGDVAAAQRRERPTELLRERRRPPGRRRGHGRDDGEQLQRLEHQPDSPEHRSGRGRADQDGRRRRGLADGDDRRY
jgi:hypothetical protein